jgi:glycosyltransferase involved in cell wall biosynthesis
MPLSPAPAVSVLVACRDEAGDIEACLRSILSQQPPRGGFEVVVADGMSKDGTRGIVARIAAGDRRVTLVDNPAGIVATGLNAAIRAARGRILARMDVRARYAPDYLRKCVEILEESGADNVGGPYRTVAGGRGPRAIAAALESMFAVGRQRARQVDHEGYVDTVVFGCWRREAFDRFGLFDELLVRNQDDEHNLRILRAGGRIWQSPAIRLWYRPRSSLRGLFGQYFGYGYWKVPVIMKHRRPASVRHLVPGAFLLAVLALPVLAASWRPALRLWLIVLGVYGLAGAAASVRTAARAGWDLLPRLPAAFAVVHVAYGLGFLVRVAECAAARGAIAAGRVTGSRLAARMLPRRPSDA